MFQAHGIQFSGQYTKLNASNIKVRGKWVSAIQASDLPSSARSVCFILFFRSHNETGECFPSEELLAKHLNVTERTIRRGVEKLIDAGWFTKKRRGRAGTNYYANYENRTLQSGKDDPKNRTYQSGKNDPENRTPQSGNDAPENRTPLSLKPDNNVKKNRTSLSSEPKGEPNQELIPPLGFPPTQTDDLTDAAQKVVAASTK